MNLCPRCETDSYSTYDQSPTEEAPFAAVSRTDNETLVCSPCGMDEAMQDFLTGLTPKDRWPVPSREFSLPREVAG